MRTISDDWHDKKCVDCKFHKHESYSDGFVCVCDDSDYLADWTPADFSCQYFEERER